MLRKLTLFGLLICLSAVCFADAKGALMLKNHASKIAAAKSLDVDLAITRAEVSYEYEFVVLKENKAIVKTPALETITDGKTIWTYFPKRKVYFKKDGVKDSSVWMNIPELYVWMPFFKSKIFDGIDATYLGKIKFQKSTYDAITFNFRSRTLKLYIDPATGIGKHVEISGSRVKNTIIVSKTFKIDDPNVTEAMFTWNVPDGVKEINEADLYSVEWYTDYETALAKAKELGKRVLIDFYTDWCHFCKLLDENVYNTVQFKEMAANFVLCKVNGDKRSDLVQKYSVSGYPTTIFTNENGDPIHQIVGYCDLNEYLGEMRTALSK